MGVHQVGAGGAVGEISIGVNPRHLNCGGNGRSRGQSRVTLGCYCKSLLFTGVFNRGGGSSLIIVVVLWSTCFVFDRGNPSWEAALGMGYKLREE